jgi:hypothetical protein
MASETVISKGWRQPFAASLTRLAAISGPGPAMWVGVVVFIISMALLPLVERTWRPTGDEPHYLLAAHSLVTDLDFDLANNYHQLDYLDFYYSKDITPQVRLTPSGQQILDHQLALPVLIAPAYALAGRAGVLAFQVILASLLAGLTFKLAALVSRDNMGALLAALVVSLGPLLLFYPYLIYPELIAGLLTTLILYLSLRQDRPTPAAASLILVSLCILPWLNRRFVPLALLLALLVLWSWRKRNVRTLECFNVLTFQRSNVILLALLVSIGGVVWFNSQLSAPARVDIETPASAVMVWERLGRGIGWLVDQQRGLLIFAPVYWLAWWGLPWLLQESWRQRNRHWMVVLPFLLSFIVVTAAGGFWVAWEVGPRFLVVALPALAPLLALAWRYYSRSLLWLALAGLLTGVTLLNGLVIIKNPELPYKSSLPLFYAAKTGLPFPKFLPDLAGFERLWPAVTATEVQILTQNGESIWLAQPGQSMAVVRSGPLSELPFGHYQLTWPLKVEPDLPPQTELLRLSAKTSGGRLVFNTIITAADLPADGRWGEFSAAFTNPNVDRWRTPLVFHAVSTGQARIWAGDVLFAPDLFYGWIMPYLFLAVGVVVAGWGWIQTRSQTQFGNEKKRFKLVPKLSLGTSLKTEFGGKFYPVIAWGMVVSLPLITAGYTIRAYQPDDRTYAAAALSHYVGRADEGDGWLVDPQVDPPQKAIDGPFEIFDPGLYRVVFRLKLLQAVETVAEVARLRVMGASSADPLVSQPLRGEHFARPNLYHDFVLTLDNPRRQALNFEVDYLGVAPLVIKQVTIGRGADVE